MTEYVTEILSRNSRILLDSNVFNLEADTLGFQSSDEILNPYIVVSLQGFLIQRGDVISSPSSFLYVVLSPLLFMISSPLSRLFIISTLSLSISIWYPLPFISFMISSPLSVVYDILYSVPRSWYPLSLVYDILSPHSPDILSYLALSCHTLLSRSFMISSPL